MTTTLKGGGSGASLIRADALRLPLADESVDLIVTSPPLEPYFGLRVYTDGAERYPGQLGAEDTPAAFLDALWAATAEMERVLKPSGSIFVNLGDKYCSPGGHADDGASSRLEGRPNLRLHGRPERRDHGFGVREKSLLLLPELYRAGCTGALAQLGGPDPGLNLIARAVIVWDKPNGLPESVRDRVRRSHEDWVHLTKEPRYYAAVDEIREPRSPGTHPGRRRSVANLSGNGVAHRTLEGDTASFNPLGNCPARSGPSPANRCACQSTSYPPARETWPRTGS